MSGPYHQPAERQRTRVDLLLHLFDQAIVRLERVQLSLADDDIPRAALLMVEAQHAVYAIAQACIPAHQALNCDLLRVCGYCLECLRTPERQPVEAARNILDTLREGFRNVRKKAIQLEKSGELPPLEPLPKVNVRA